MKIVNIIGGLGNQMFQYAFAIALKNEHPEDDVYVDIQHYKNAITNNYHGNNFIHNGYEIEKVFPNSSIRVARAFDIMKVSFYLPNHILIRAMRRIIPKRKTEYLANNFPYIFLPEVFDISGDCYFDGYWMTPKYFSKYRNKILSEFAFKEIDTKENKCLAELLGLDNSIAIHVRRGDYVGSSAFGNICSIEYYRKAINEAIKLIPNPTFFIFSNDEAWCTEQFKDIVGDGKVHYISHNIGEESFRDMQLMSLSKCNIIANSSFSWWGAYLNQRNEHIVFCPKKWHNSMEHSDLYMPEWIKL